MMYRPDPYEHMTEEQFLASIPYGETTGPRSIRSAAEIAERLWDEGVDTRVKRRRGNRKQWCRGRPGVKHQWGCWQPGVSPGSHLFKMKITNGTVLFHFHRHCEECGKLDRFSWRERRRVHKP